MRVVTLLVVIPITLAPVGCTVVGYTVGREIDRDRWSAVDHENQAQVGDEIRWKEHEQTYTGTVLDRREDMVTAFVEGTGDTVRVPLEDVRVYGVPGNVTAMGMVGGAAVDLTLVYLWIVGAIQYSR